MCDVALDNKLQSLPFGLALGNQGPDIGIGGYVHRSDKVAYMDEIRMTLASNEALGCELAERRLRSFAQPAAPIALLILLERRAEDDGGQKRGEPVKQPVQRVPPDRGGDLDPADHAEPDFYRYAIALKARPQIDLAVSQIDMDESHGHFHGAAPLVERRFPVRIVVDRHLCGVDLTAGFF